MARAPCCRGTSRCEERAFGARPFLQVDRIRRSLFSGIPSVSVAVFGSIGCICQKRHRRSVMFANRLYRTPDLQHQRLHSRVDSRFQSAQIVRYAVCCTRFCSKSSSNGWQKTVAADRKRSTARDDNPTAVRRLGQGHWLNCPETTGQQAFHESTRHRFHKRAKR